jgi:hypothetical protein
MITVHAQPMLPETPPASPSSTGRPSHEAKLTLEGRSSFTNFYRFDGTFKDLSLPSPPSSPEVSNRVAAPKAIDPVAEYSPGLKGFIVRTWDKYNGPLANLIQILGGVIGTGAVAFTAYEALTWWRQKVADMVSSDYLTFTDTGIHFKPEPRMKLEEIFPNRVERRIFHDAYNAATPEFPFIYLDPRRHQKILEWLRSDLLAKEEHDIVILRKQVISKVGYLQRDQIKFEDLVNLLENPLHYYRQHVTKEVPKDVTDQRPDEVRGQGRRVILMHLLEAAALITILSVDEDFRKSLGFKGEKYDWNILKRALRASRPKLTPESNEFKEAYTHIKKNGLRLLGMLALPSQRTMELLEQSAAENDLKCLARATPSPEESKEIIRKRMMGGGIWSRYIGPALFKLANLGENKKWDTDLSPEPYQTGIFPFFMILRGK